MPKEFNFPKKLTNKVEDYSCLIDFYNEWKNLKSEHIIIDLKETSFIEANIVALLGAMFDELIDIKYMNIISLRNLSKEIEQILKKNNFLSYFGSERIEDTFDTTIEYRKIKSDNVIEFIEYLNTKLFTESKFPDMPTSLRKTLISSLAEIFVNAGMHSGCEYVHTCGQYFPYYQRLDFSIVNIGTTIRENVDIFINGNTNQYIINSTNAINWAVQEKHSTKIDESGGFGLSKTSEFVKKNKGKLFIISDDGCWLQGDSTRFRTEKFPNKFNGTMVNFEINMNDSYNYDII